MKKQVKMNLTLDRDFYDLLKEKATQDYMKVATWTKRFLIKNLLGKNNTTSNPLNHEKCK